MFNELAQYDSSSVFNKLTLYDSSSMCFIILCQVFNELAQYDSSSKRPGVRRDVIEDWQRRKRCVMWPVFTGGQDSSEIFEVCQLFYLFRGIKARIVSIFCCCCTGCCI